MATYLILNIAVLTVVAVLLGMMPRRPSKAWIFTFVILLVLTLVFDNILIWLDMFSYAADKILGIHIFMAPIEDFMYAILAVILIPAVWHKLGDSRV